MAVARWQQHVSSSSSSSDRNDILAQSRRSVQHVIFNPEDRDIRYKYVNRYVIRDDKNLLTLVGWKTAYPAARGDQFIRENCGKSIKRARYICEARSSADYASEIPFDHCHYSLHRTDTIMSDDGNLAYCHSYSCCSRDDISTIRGCYWSTYRNSAMP